MISVVQASVSTIGDFCAVRMERGGNELEVRNACRTEIALPQYGKDRVVFLVYIDSQVAAYGRAMRYVHNRDGNLYSTTQALPEGWYLRGVVVRAKYRRSGLARRLTEERLKWIASRAEEVFCFLDSDEKGTLPMYESFGFRTLSADWRFVVPAMKDETGILMRLAI